jgi:hypothetical protein
MRFALLISLVWIATAFSLEGPDLMLLGDQFAPDNKSMSLTSLPDSAFHVEAATRHAYLYGIKSLNWTYASARYDFKNNSAVIAFRSYGIDKLYQSSWYSIAARKSVIKKLSFGLGYTRNELVYGDNLLKISEDFIAIDAGANFDKFALRASAGNIALDKNNKKYNKPEYTAACFWQADSSLSVSCLLFNDKRDHNRLMITQNLAVHKSLIIIAGLISGPEVYYAGFEIVYKRFVFGYTFYAIGGLDDCSRLSLGYR